MIDKLQEEEIRKLISFLEENDIPFEKDIKEIRIKGQVKNVNLYYREIEVETNNEKNVKVQYSDLLVIIGHNEKGKIVNIDSVILYEKGYLIIRY